MSKLPYDVSRLRGRRGDRRPPVSELMALPKEFSTLVPETWATDEPAENLKCFKFGIGLCPEIAKLPKPQEQVQLAQECEKDYSTTWQYFL